MTYQEVVKRIAKLSRDTNRPFAKEDVVTFFDLLHDVILESVDSEEKFVVKGVFKIEPIERKAKVGHYDVTKGIKVTLPSKKSVRITLMEDFKNECEKILNQ
ncbi:MAG: HU family DNA-binding protein [Peptostreptococcaceae bacterium]